MPRELKVLIAEDELLIRMGIKLSCDWAALGMRVVADAADGQEALEAYMRCSPDIMLVDVRMPLMTGVELVEHVRRSDHDCRIIAITCVNEFDTLHQLTRCGITDYLLKADMTPDMLSEALRKARSEWESMHAETNAAGQPGVTGAAAPALAYRGLIVMYSPAFTDDKPPMLMQTLRQMVCEQFTGEATLSSGGPGRIICRTEATPDEDTDKRLRLIHVHFKRVFGQPLSLLSARTNGDCDFADTLERLNELYDDGYWFMDDVMRHEPDEEWLAGIKAANHAALKQPGISISIPQSALRVLEQQLPQLPTDSIAAWKDNMVSMTLHIMLHVLRLPLTNVGRVSSALLAAPTAYASVEMCLQTIEHCIYQSLELRVRRPEIRQALDFINRNFERSISTTDAALHVGLSPHHFSNLFKRETGMTFVGYLNHYRIEQAKLMLEDTSMYAYEIASRCGFADAAYFSRIFKQVTGVHPSHYRKSGEGDNI